MELGYFVLGIIATLFVLLIVFAIAANFCFDDHDPDQYIDTFAPPSKETEALVGCTHTFQTDIVMEASTVCEEVWTMCDTCNQVLNKRTDC
jgi:hypothetical protein